MARQEKVKGLKSLDQCAAALGIEKNLMEQLRSKHTGFPEKAGGSNGVYSEEKLKAWWKTVPAEARTPAKPAPAAQYLETKEDCARHLGTTYDALQKASKRYQEQAAFPDKEEAGYDQAKVEAWWAAVKPLMKPVSSEPVGAVKIPKRARPQCIGCRSRNVSVVSSDPKKGYIRWGCADCGKKFKHAKPEAV